MLEPVASIGSNSSSGDKTMLSKVLGSAVLAGFLVAVSAPIAAYAADAPKTKAECAKTAGMTWDAKTKTCVAKK